MAIDYVGYVYAGTVAAGGIMGFAKAGSVPSLIAGLTFGAFLGYGAYLNSLNPPQPLVQLGTSVVLGAFMGMRWAKSGKFMPPGIVCVLSGGVIAYNLVMYNKYLFPSSATRLD